MHEHTLDVPNSPPRSATSDAPPMSTVSSVVDSYKCLRADFVMTSSSGSDIATTASRPETPAMFSVDDDLEIEEGEIRKGPNVTVRHPKTSR